MAKNNPTIPWADDKTWGQAILSISKTVSAMSAQSALRTQVATMQSLVQQIVQGYEELETHLERLCLTTCPTCADVCCLRATVWYDVKDLLFLSLHTCDLPKTQIYRLPDNSCCNLTSTGCRLHRSDRPFICTWYICPAQNKELKKRSGGREGLDVFRSINRIKTARKYLEQVYIKASCGEPDR